MKKIYQNFNPFAAMFGMIALIGLVAPTGMLISSYKTSKHMEKIDPLNYRTEYVLPLDVKLNIEKDYATLELTSITDEDTTHVKRNLSKNTHPFIRTESTLNSYFINIEDIITELHKDINDGFTTRIGLLYKKGEKDTLRGLKMNIEHDKREIYFLEK